MQVFETKDVEDNKVMGILAYIWLFALIPYFMGKESPYATFHGKQGLNLAIIETAVGFVLGIIAAIIGFIPFIGWIFAGLISLVSLAFCLTFSIIGIVYACGNTAKELPILGKIKIVK